jgi:hypothetical protein
MKVRTLTLTAANDSGSAHQTTVAITGIVALLARSQARRLAKAAVPANATTAPAARKVQP